MPDLKTCSRCGEDVPPERYRNGKCIPCKRDYDRVYKRQYNAKRNAERRAERAAARAAREAEKEQKRQQRVEIIDREEARPDWHLRASCRNMTEAQADAAFAPEHGRVVKEVEQLCEACPVRADCLISGMKEPVSRRSQDRIIWGGLRPSEMEDLRDALAERGIVIEPEERPFINDLQGRPGKRTRGTDLSRALEGVAGDPDAAEKIVARYREEMLANITTG